MAGAVTILERKVARVPALAVANRFRGYKPMEEKAVRKVEVTGDELSYLRHRREVLRSMTPEQALSVIEFHRWMDAPEALELARKQGKIIVPHDVHDRILTETDHKHDRPVWTGTAIIYESGAAPFKDRVVTNWTRNDQQFSVAFDVPEQFRGIRNAVIAADYPDFELIRLGDNSLELRAAEVALLHYFPELTEYWYGYDERFRIPIGDKRRHGSVDPSARYLFRAERSVGLIIRGGNYYSDSQDDGRRLVQTEYATIGSPLLGVALF